MPLTKPLFVNIFSIYIANVSIKNLKTSAVWLKCVNTEVKSQNFLTNLAKLIAEHHFTANTIASKRAVILQWAVRCFQQI